MNHSIKKSDIHKLSQCLPVEGLWTSSRAHYQIAQDIADEIQLMTDFSVTVKLFRHNGEHLQGDERTGTMVVIRN